MRPTDYELVGVVPVVSGKEDVLACGTRTADGVDSKLHCRDKSGELRVGEII